MPGIEQLEVRPIFGQPDVAQRLAERLRAQIEVALILGTASSHTARSASA